MSAPPPADDEHPADGGATPVHRYRIAFAVTTMLALGIIVTLPFSLESVVSDVLGPATGRMFSLLKERGAAPVSASSRLHLAVTAVDEIQLLATVRVSGHRTCAGDCDWQARLLLVSVLPQAAEAEGMPPAVTVPLPNGTDAVSQNVQLPVSGFPIRYPFDHYDLVMAAALQRVFPDGHVETVPPDETPRHLSLSIQELLPSLIMSAPVPVETRTLRATGDPIDFAAAWSLSFQRPRYLRLLTVLLVLLIAAAAAYSVFLRPLTDLVVNSGALVLGIWGIRSILTPANLYFLTSVDLALSTVILFLLGALTVKALLLAHDRGGLAILRPRRRRGQP